MFRQARIFFFFDKFCVLLCTHRHLREELGSPSHGFLHCEQLSGEEVTPAGLLTIALLSAVPAVTLSSSMLELRGKTRHVTTTADVF